METILELREHLVELQRNLDDIAEGVGRTSGLTASQMQVVEIIGRHQPLRMKELAAMLGVTTATLTFYVNKLERQDVVARWQDTEDRRSFFVGLTDKGREIFRAGQKENERLLGNVFSQLQPNDLENLSSCLKELNGLLRGIAAA